MHEPPLAPLLVPAPDEPLDDVPDDVPDEVPADPLETPPDPLPPDVPPPPLPLPPFDDTDPELFPELDPPPLGGARRPWPDEFARVARVLASAVAPDLGAAAPRAAAGGDRETGNQDPAQAQSTSAHLFEKCSPVCASPSPSRSRSKTAHFTATCDRGSQRRYRVFPSHFRRLRCGNAVALNLSVGVVHARAPDTTSSRPSWTASAGQSIGDVSAAPRPGDCILLPVGAGEDR